MQNKKAFSFVEIIIVISILALLAVVGFSIQGASKQKAQNTRAVGDIQTLNNSFQSYLTEQKTLPNPKGNINYFGSGSEYVHVDAGSEDDTSASFGKHGFVTENILPKKYLNYLPLDPRTSQYYAFGKTTNSQFFEIAGILKIEGVDVASVSGNYPGENGPYNLIKEYNGPNFVSNKSTTSFPYNPDEKILVAKINSFSGTVSVNGNGYIISGTQLLNHTLVEGDTLTVPTHGSATVYYSDGSQSTLGDTNSTSILHFTNLEYPTDNNLVTRIQLALESGTIWTKATSLNNDSEFEIYTQDMSASVRGTIFGLQAKSSTRTLISVQKGSVAVKQIPQIIAGSPNTIDSIKDSITSTTIKPILTNIPTGGNVTEVNGDTVITEPTSGTGITPFDSSNPSETAPSITIPFIEINDFNTNLQLQIESVKIDTTLDTPEIQIDIPANSLQAQTNKIALLKGDELYLSSITPSNTILSLTGSTDFQQYSYITTNNNSRSGLILKNISPSNGTTSKVLSEIIPQNSDFQLYFCRLTGKKLKCGGKKHFQPNNGMLNFTTPVKKTVLDDIVLDQQEKNEEVVITEPVITHCDLTLVGEYKFITQNNSHKKIKHKCLMSGAFGNPQFDSCLDGYTGDNCNIPPSCTIGTSLTTGTMIDGNCTHTITNFPADSGNKWSKTINIGTNGYIVKVNGTLITLKSGKGYGNTIKFKKNYTTGGFAIISNSTNLTTTNTTSLEKIEIIKSTPAPISFY